MGQDYSCMKMLQKYCHVLMRSLLSTPRFSPLIVTRVPGGPSLGEIPVTWGGGLRMLLSIFPS